MDKYMNLVKHLTTLKIHFENTKKDYVSIFYYCIVSKRLSFEANSCNLPRQDATLLARIE